jgi:hypothetical protein
MGVCAVSCVRTVSGAQAIRAVQATTTKTVAHPLLTLPSFRGASQGFGSHQGMHEASLRNAATFSAAF